MRARMHGGRRPEAMSGASDSAPDGPAPADGERVNPHLVGRRRRNDRLRRALAAHRRLEKWLRLANALATQ